MRTQVRDRSGFTLIEVLVAMGVSLLLGLTLVNILVQSRRSLDQASGHLDLVRATRIPIDRMALYLTSAVAVPGVDAILYPAVHDGSLTNVNERDEPIFSDDPKSWTRYVIFRTTENFLDPNFDPEEILDIDAVVQNYAVYDSDLQTLYDYILWYEDGTHINESTQEDRALLLGRLSMSADFRDYAWAIDDPWEALDPDIKPIVLARNIDDVGFFRRISNGIQVSVLAEKEVRYAMSHEKKHFRNEAVIQLPTISWE